MSGVFWDYTKVEQPTAYGPDRTYDRALSWLDHEGWVIEDWGCGTAYGRKFITKGTYIGIDWAESRHCDKVYDLELYRSNVDAILIRHVLEHNLNWWKILDNATASARHRIALVTFIPFSDTGQIIRTSPLELSFRKSDVLERLRGFDIREEEWPTSTQYGEETILYCERSDPWEAAR